MSAKFEQMLEEQMLEKELQKNDVNACQDMINLVDQTKGFNAMID